MSFEERMKKEQNDMFDDYMLEHYGCVEARADEIPDEEPEYTYFIGVREDGSFYRSEKPNDENGSDGFVVDDEDLNIFERRKKKNEAHR